MKKPLSLSVLLLLWIFLVSAGCSPEMKMVSRVLSGSASLTPFLPKATFTPTDTPLVKSQQIQALDLNINVTKTGESTGADLQESFTAEVTAAPSETGVQSQTVKPSSTAAPATGLLPSLTIKPTRSYTSTSIPSSAIKLPSAVSTQSGTPDPGPTSVPPTPSSTVSPPSETPVPLPSGTQVPLPTATPVPAGCSYTGNSGFENQVIDLINQERSNRGLSALTQNSQLRQAARGHSQDMACNDFFSHTGSDGSSMGSRILSAGYNFSWAAENIAASSSGGYSPQSVVSSWMNSSGHRKNILSEKAKHIGVGFRYVSDGNPGDLDAYYTANFGRP